MRHRIVTIVEHALAWRAAVWAALLGGVALLARLPLIVNTFDTSTAPDTGWYMNIAQGLLDGDGFDTEGVRTAGYPLFLAGVKLLPGPTIDAVVVIQHLLAVAVVVGVFYVADRYFGRVTAILAGAVTALAPTMMNVEHMVLPDWLFGALVLAATVALIEATGARDAADGEPAQPSVPLLIATGALFGVAANVKPTGQALIFAAPFVLAFATRAWRPTLKGTAIVTASMVVVIAPWLIHNEVRYGHLGMSNQGGTALWLRVFDQDKMPIPDDSEEGRIANQLFDRYFEDPPSYFTDPKTLPPETATESYSFVYNALIRRGYDRWEASSWQQDLAIEAILDDPVEYVTGTFRNLRQYLTYNAGPNGYEGNRLAAAVLLNYTVNPVPWKLAEVPWAFTELLIWIGFALSLAFLAIPLLLFVGPRRSRVAAAALVAVWICVALAGSLTAYVESRYAAQIGPIQFILEAAAVVLVVSAAAGLARRGVAGLRTRREGPADA